MTGCSASTRPPLVRRLIDSETGSGPNGHPTQELEGKLLELARRNPGDLRGVPIYSDAAEQQLARYERYLRGERSPVVAFGGNVIGGQAGNAGAFVAQAQMYYQMAIGTIMRSGEYGHPDLDALEIGPCSGLLRPGEHPGNWSPQSLLLSPDYVEGFSPTTQRQSLHDRGREHYRRRVNRNAAPVDRARALVELGDWSLPLLAQRDGREALRRGIRAARRATSDAGGVDQALFPTAIPVFLPPFPESARCRYERRALSGDVDVDSSRPVRPVAQGSSRRRRRRKRRSKVEGSLRSHQPRAVSPEPAGRYVGRYGIPPALHPRRRQPRAATLSRPEPPRARRACFLSRARAAPIGPAGFGAACPLARDPNVTGL